MKTITIRDFDKIAKIDSYYKLRRWNYFKEVINIVKRENPKSVLELGSYKLSIVKGCDTMDVLKEVKPTYCQNAEKTPWNIKKYYDMFIGLQVWEHLGNKQQEAFKEVMKIADKAILSFPYLWNFGNKTDIHYMIDKEKIAGWTLNIKPIETKIISNRIIYYFDFNLEKERILKLVEKNIVIKSLKYKIQGMNRDDVQQELRIAAWKAIPKFDPSRGQINTFLEKVIRNKLTDLYRRANVKLKRGII